MKNSKITPQIAVASQIVNMLQNNIVLGNGNEHFEDWCELGDTFRDSYPNQTEEFYQECENLMYEVGSYIDRVTYDYLTN